MSTTTTRMRQPATDRSGCGAPQHGTRIAYQVHGCRCDDAREDNRIYRKRLKHGYRPSYLVDATGTQRRIRALQRIGWPMKDLAIQLGRRAHGSALSSILLRPRCSRDLAQRVAALYDELSMTPGPSQATMRRAAAKGWASPLAWDDIDHDPEPADPGSYDPDEVNESTVRKAVDGTLTVDHLTRGERRAAVRRMVKRGLATREIARRLGTDARQVYRDQNTLNRRKTKRTQEAD